MDIQRLYDIYLRHPIVCNDTRRISPGCIYWSIRGERFDGNSFAAQALEAGAAYAVIDRPELAAGEKYILVEDALGALQALARHHRKQLGIPIIAITGSNGKTTTKELMLRVFSQTKKAFATPGNLNNHIGLPLTLLQLSSVHDIAIIELGANHIGENAALCEICVPDAGIITNIGKDHLEGFGGMEGVEKANAELFDSLRKTGGLAFLNTDDNRVIRNAAGLKLLRYGTSGKTDIQGKVTGRFPFLSAEILVKKSGEKINVSSYLFGSFHLYNLLAAAAAGIQYGVPLQKIKESLESYQPQNNRSQIVKQDTNTIILDAYNANPSSMGGALADFSDHPAEKKVLILGDMFELGEESKDEHKAILASIDFSRFEAVAFAGSEFYAFKNDFPKGHFFRETAELKSWFKAQRFENATIYVKGSRGMKMEEIFNL
jgi:UDP-N-acetylmuramoyl-tripeptide--D-alanyl-D-alanine ligase